MVPPHATPLPRSVARTRQLIGFSSLIVLIFCALVVYQGSQSYRAAMDDGQNDAKRLTRILSDHVELTFLDADMVLHRAIDQQLPESRAADAITEDFRGWLGKTPQIAALAMVDDAYHVRVNVAKADFDGWLEQSSRFLQNSRILEILRGASNDQIFLGRALTAGGKALILLGRRYEKPSGEFGGAVLAAISPAYLTEFYDAVALGTRKYMRLSLTDGTVLASGPLQDPVTDRLAEGMAADLARGMPPDGIKLQTAYDGKTVRILSARQLPALPILTQISLDEEDMLAGWRMSRIRDVGFLAMFTVFGSVLSWFAIIMSRQIARAEESESAAILASQAKSEFLANMSHELRTPLNAIIGFSEMMSSGYFGPLSPRQKERVHDIHLCGSHLLQLISDILEFSKGDAGKLELVEEQVDLGEIASECERIMSGKIRSKNISFIVAAEPGTLLLWGDKRKVRQILLNLLSNAVKFTPENGQIKLSCLPDAQGGLAIIVSDNGIGIAEADIPKALSVFGQVGRGQEGTGLGLPLCKMYAELHGGKLELKSKPKEGTTVRIIFPATRTLSR